MISIILKQSCHNPKEHYWSMSILLTWIGFPMKRNEFENKQLLKTSPPSKKTPPCNPPFGSCQSKSKSLHWHMISICFGLC